jgi:hypothetical protein
MADAKSMTDHQKIKSWARSAAASPLRCRVPGAATILEFSE